MIAYLVSPSAFAIPASRPLIPSLGTEQKQITLGRHGIVTLAQAREKARKILAERKLGTEPRTSPTFKKVLYEYLDRRAIRCTERLAEAGIRVGGVGESYDSA